MNASSEAKREIDARRLACGLAPIFVDPPRPLTQAERDGRNDVIVRHADGSVRKHYVPMVRDGWVFYVDVLEAR